MPEIGSSVSMLDEDTQRGKFLTFTLEREEYGIDIKNVTEIIGIQLITEVPDLPVHIKGIINLRGKIIPVMDVRLRFKKPQMNYDERTCIIVVEIKGISIGLIVDRVLEVIMLNDADIVAPPGQEAGFGCRYIKGIGKSENNVKLLLDCDLLLNDKELDEISTVN